MQSIKLNLIPGSVLPVVNVSQYDAHRQFALQVYEGATAYSLTGKTVEIRGTKPDGNGFAYDATDGVVSVSNNVVTISTTQQMTAVGGHVMTELRITSGHTILGTLNFIMDVEPSALSDDTPISETEIPAIERQLEELVEEIQVYTEDAEAWAAGTRDGQSVPSSDPAYQNNAKYYAGNAGTSATNADTNALKSEGYAVGKQNGTDVGSSSPYYHNNAKYFDDSAQNAYTQTRTARDAAMTYKYGSEGWAVGTRDGQPVESSSPYYHNNANYYRSQASLSATAAADSADDAAADALKSEGFADGEQNGAPVGPGSPYYQNNAKYWRDQAAQYAAGGLNFVGSVEFANIPTTGLNNGDLYNITDDFTTDSRFVEGAGIPCKAGTDIAWVASSGKWDLLNTGGGSTTLYDLADTQISYPSSGSPLVYNSTAQKWVNGAVIPYNLSQLSDTTITTPTDGEVLKYNATTQKWANANLPTVPADLDDLSDVTLSSPTSGQFLKFDGSKWVNGNGGGGASDLDDLGDVTITTPTNGQVLTYDAASQKWVNANGGGGVGGFDYKDWLTAGDLNPMSYADLAAVLADEKTVRKLMTIHTAVDYLASQDLGADVLSILSDNLCAKWINLRDYALDTLYANQIFATQMDAIGKYGYGEWAKLSESPETWGPKGNVPIMTSNTAPYGTASAYQVFDGNASTTASGTDFSYQFVNPVCPKDFICKNTSGQDITGGTLQASNDGSTWSAPVDGEYYLNLRVHFAASTTVATVQFYGRELKVSVPVMTSNTAPYGKAISNPTPMSGTTLYDVFNPARSSNYSVFSYNASRTDGYVGYRFTSKALLKEAVIKSSVTEDNSNISAFTVLYSDDGSTWNDASERVTGAEAYNQLVCAITETAPHEYWAIGKIKNNGNTGNFILTNAQFYGSDYSEYDWDADNPRHYLYDHGVEPNGVNTLTNSNASATGAKEISSVYLHKNGAQCSSHIISQQIDATAYDLERVVVGNKLHSSSTAYPIMAMNANNTWSYSSSAIAEKQINLTSSVPYGAGIDISSINQNCYAMVAASSNGNIDMGIDFVEWWLE